MIITFTKQFFIIFSSFFLYRKILNLNSYSASNKICLFLFSVLNTLCCCYLTTTIPGISITAQILLFYFSVIWMLHTSPKLAFTATMISFSISYVVISIFITVFVISFFFTNFELTTNISFIIVFISGLLTYLALHIPFHLKRFKNGMRFLYHETFSNSGLIISIIILLSLSIARLIDNPSNIEKALPILLVLLSSFILLFWWKNQITKSYLEKIRKAELESLRQEVIDKDAEIQKLKENNASLAHIIHRDNKLIPAMESAVCEFLEDYALLSPNDFHAKGQALASQLKEMSASRTGILTEYQAKGQHIPITGVCSVDALFSYMQKKASSIEIAFDVKISTDLLTFTNSVISPDDLAHLLSDLIENAIIATKNSLARKIQLHISFVSNHYVVEILDTGDAFPIDILQDFGIEQKTSHVSEGGSGIGLMDIWKLKKKYRASLHIQEFSSDHDSFQKKISLIFDSKNHYLIQTYRPQEILMTLKRSDLYVLENET